MLGHILPLLLRIHELKLTARTGWNVEYPPEHRFKTRSVPEAESVADHSYSVAMYAFGVATTLGLDVESVVLMALVHDLPEIITGDGITATLPDAERQQAEVHKGQREMEAAKALFLPHGEFGQECYMLWLEYHERETQIAQIVWQLDKFEAAAQAVLYAQQGHTLDPVEFVDYAERKITHPLILDMLAELRRSMSG